MQLQACFALKGTFPCSLPTLQLFTSAAHVDFHFEIAQGRSARRCVHVSKHTGPIVRSINGTCCIWCAVVQMQLQRSLNIVALHVFLLLQLPSLVLSRRFPVGLWEDWGGKMSNTLEDHTQL